MTLHTPPDSTLVVLELDSGNETVFEDSDVAYTEHPVGNVVIERASKDVMESVRGGKSLAGPLAEHAVFPAMVVQMMSVGEDTGALDQMLHKISDFYDQEVSATVDSLTSLIEPLLMVFMGVTVGGMVVALYMPMFQIINLVK